MRIHRSNPGSSFLMLPNATAQDTRLSWAARGLLIELISRPLDWEANADLLSEQATGQRGEKLGEGRRGVRAVFAELEEYGYIVRTRERVARGRFTTTIDVYDTSGHHRGTASGTPVGGTSADGSSVVGTSLQRTEEQRTELQNTEDKDPPTLADARVGALTSAARATNSKPAADDPWAVVDEARRNEIVREAVIDGYTVEEGMARADAQMRKVTLAMRGQEADFDAFVDAVDRMPPNQLSDTLVELESRRKKIYGNARRAAMAYLEREGRQILRGPNSGHVMQTLVYKHLLLHYFETAEEWPAWLVRPLNAYMGRVA